MKKIDLKKQLKSLYSPSAREVSEVKVPAMNFIMIDGKGDPNKAPQFQAAIEALYPVSYAIKFDFKKNHDIDYPVMALEGLWWADNMDDFVSGNRDNWLWTLMIMQPDFVTEEIYKQNLQAVKKKKNLPALEKLRFEKFDEGCAAQIMHIGPFSEEGENIVKIHEFIKDRSGKITGKHHEIYLSDFRRVAPEKMKTVLRQPFK